MMHQLAQVQLHQQWIRNKEFVVVAPSIREHHIPAIQTPFGDLRCCFQVNWHNMDLG